MKHIGETSNAKRERFRRLASHRTTEVLRKLKILGNCANRGAYEYSREDVERIFDAVDKKLKEVKNKFYFPSQEGFKL